jgi:hypothetical protein
MAAAQLGTLRNTNVKQDTESFKTWWTERWIVK